MNLNADFTDLLDALDDAGVKYMIVGAHAMAAHGVPRATADIDIFVLAEVENAKRVYRALVQFGAPVVLHGITARDFEVAGDVYQMGLPPRRIDLLTAIDGVSFRDAWIGHQRMAYEGRSVPVIGLRELVRNKLASGRPKDRADIDLLQAVGVDVEALR